MRRQDKENEAGPSPGQDDTMPDCLNAQSVYASEWIGPKRRDFLTGCASILACGILPACGSESPVPTTDADGVDDLSSLCTTVEVDVADLAVGELQFIPGGGLIGRDAGGLYAMSSICTHKACDMGKEGEILDDGIECLCHHSIFGPTGTVREGPAERELPHYKVTRVNDTTLRIEAGNRVNRETRTP